MDKAEIRSALASWQMGMMLEETTGKGRQERARSMGDGKDAGRLSQGQATHSVSGELHKKAASGRRREPRRHTLQNGIDYNMVMAHLPQVPSPTLPPLDSNLLVVFSPARMDDSTLSKRSVGTFQVHFITLRTRFVGIRGFIFYIKYISYVHFYRCVSRS